MITISTAVTAITKDIAPGKIVFGTYGRKVDHITCIETQNKRETNYIKSSMLDM